MLTTLPFVIVLLLCTFVRAEVLHIPTLLEFSDTAPIITATALVIGFMLAGIMGDYKEAEKLPGELACALQSIDDCILANTATLNEADFAALKQLNAKLFSAVMYWLINHEGLENCYTLLREMIVSTDAPIAFKGNVIKNIDTVRRHLTRIDVIRRTDFIQTGYALLEVFVTIALSLLIFANFKNAIAQYVVVGAISLVYVYMIRLIRDLDNPFDYKQDGSFSGAAEVNYFPLTEAGKRLNYQPTSS